MFGGQPDKHASNISRARTKEHVQEFRISPEIMSTMTFDLVKISHHLTYGLIATIDLSVSRDDLSRDLPTLADSWQYTEHQRPAPSRPKRGAS